MHFFPLSSNYDVGSLAGLSRLLAVVEKLNGQMRHQPLVIDLQGPLNTNLIPCTAPPGLTGICSNDDQASTDYSEDLINL